MAFQTGASGNPQGRPKGTGSRQQLFNMLVEPHRNALINTAINLALDGNEAMLRLLLDRMLPAKPTDEPIQIDMTDAFDFNNVRAVTQLGLESLKAVMSGKITPEEAGRISTLLGAHHKTFETTELIERVKALEAQEN